MVDFMKTQLDRKCECDLIIPEIGRHVWKRHSRDAINFKVPSYSGNEKQGAIIAELIEMA
jgi:hypothetical protein